MAQEQLAYATKHRTMDTSDYDSADDFILTQRSNSPMYEPLTPPSESEEPEPGPGPEPEQEPEAEAHRAQSKSNTSAGSVKRKQLFEVKQVPEDLPELLITDEDLTANQVQVELPEIIITDDEDLTVSHVPMVLPEIVITHDDLPGKPKVSAKQGQPSAKGCNVNQVAEGSGVNNSVQELPGEPGTSEGGRVKRALKRRHLGQPHQSEGVPPVKK
ncbi:uncharacterized protein LOC128327876 [Hemicordylus capensis]|uniref:uncharacterized protein LOC128327876 n=1 Tax=Hemicordylus capensis TaxID=884348 RepID=UPI0023042770|nr:uncharacterized protein LOC128327876 [Hemicordylus capensis]